MLSSVQECINDALEVCVSDALGAAGGTRKAMFYAMEELSGSRAAQAQVLYRATRDLYRPRIINTPGRTKTWRIDRVFYTGEPLPTGEYDRSIGHWNSAVQREAFQVDEGCVQMLVLSPEPGSVLRLINAPAGSIVAVPPGGWHLTYACRGPATVTNVYTDEHGSESVKNGSDHAAKYSRGRPVPVGLCQSRTGPVLFGSPSWLPGIVSELASRHEHFGALPDFAELFVSARHDHYFGRIEKMTEQQRFDGASSRFSPATWKGAS